MIRQNFNHQWMCMDGSASFLEKLQMTQSEGAFITLPHDAMIHENRDPIQKMELRPVFIPGAITNISSISMHLNSGGRRP